MLQPLNRDASAFFFLLRPSFLSLLLLLSFRLFNNLIRPIENTARRCTTRCALWSFREPLDGTCATEIVRTSSDDWVCVWFSADEAGEGDFFVI
jgi:hypothetical protein